MKNWRGLTLRSPSIQTNFIVPGSNFLRPDGPLGPVKESIEPFAINAALNDMAVDSTNINLNYSIIKKRSSLQANLKAMALAAKPAPIDAILTKFREGIGDVGISIESLESLLDGVGSLSGELNVNSIFTLTPEGFTQEDIITNHITFFVAKAWMEENGIHPWAIQMNRWDEDQATWVPLLAKLDSEDDDNIFYTVAPPTFSLWAIIGAAEIAPIRFEEDNLQIRPATAKVGDEIEISVVVSNLTNEQAKYNAVLWLDSEVENSLNVIIPANSTATVSFTTIAGVGEQTVRIGKQLGGIGIAPEPSAPSPAATPVPAPAATPAQARLVRHQRHSPHPRRYLLPYRYRQCQIQSSAASTKTMTATACG